MTVADDLRAARALIEDPKHWTKGAAARDVHGERVNVDSPKAVRWCGWGALYKTGSWRGRSSPAEWVLVDAIVGDTLVGYNDTHTHAEVLTAYDRAIALAEGTR